MEAPAAGQPNINLLHVAALVAAAGAAQPALAAIAAAVGPAVLAVASHRTVQLGAAAGLAAALVAGRLCTPAERERRWLQRELDRNAALDGAPQAKRAEMVAQSWGLRKRRRDLLAFLLNHGLDQHNQRRLCRAAPPSLARASPAQLLQFFNRAGVVVPPYRMPPRPLEAPPEAWDPLRREAAGFLRVWQFNRFVLCIVGIADNRVAALSALGVTCLLPAPERQQAVVLARLADELTGDLLDDKTYARHLSQLDRQLVESGELEGLLEQVLAVAERAARDEARRRQRRASRRFQEAQLQQRARLGSVFQHTSTSQVLHDAR